MKDTKPTTDKPRCAKLHNWKTPKPTDDELFCMDCGRRLSLSSPDNAFKINAIIHRSERLSEAIVKARTFQKARTEPDVPF